MFTVWSGPPCHKHFHWHLDVMTTYRPHSIIERSNKFLPTWLCWLCFSSICIYDARLQSVWWVMMAHVKWRVHDVLHDMFASFDHVVQGIYETRARACTRFPHSPVKSSKRVRACTQILKISWQKYEKRACKLFPRSDKGHFYLISKFGDSSLRFSTTIRNFI